MLSNITLENLTNIPNFIIGAYIYYLKSTFSYLFPFPAFSSRNRLNFFHKVFIFIRYNIFYRGEDHYRKHLFIKRERLKSSFVRETPCIQQFFIQYITIFTYKSNMMHVIEKICRGKTAGPFVWPEKLHQQFHFMWITRPEVFNKMVVKVPSICITFCSESK